MKRVMDGRVFDTQTSTELFVTGPEDSLAWFGIYQTRHGAFFSVTVDHDGDSTTFASLADDEARRLTEKHANHLVEDFFGKLPEHGAAEKRMTIRLPVNLANRVEREADRIGATVNSYVLRTLEKSLATDIGSSVSAG